VESDSEPKTANKGKKRGKGKLDNTQECKKTRPGKAMRVKKVNGSLIISGKNQYPWVSRGKPELGKFHSRQERSKNRRRGWQTNPLT